jgi:hypothetical protein
VQQLKAPNWKIALGLPSLVIICCIAIVLSPIYETQKDRLSLAILLDLIISAPLLYYISIYKTNVSKKTVIRVFMIGLLIAGILIGKNNSKTLITVKYWIAPLLEFWVVFSIVVAYLKARKKVLLTGISEIDFLPFCRDMISNYIGNKKIETLISSEIAVLFYAFSFKRKPIIDNNIKFSYHKNNGIQLVLGTLLSLFLIETTGMHFVFLLWSKTAAWILTLLSAYTCLQLFAHMRAIVARPIVLGDTKLELRNGLVGDAIIPYAIIKRIEFTKKDPVEGLIQKLALIKGLEGHNVVIHLSETITITRIFGIEKSCNTILFNCDQPKLFEKAINLMRTIACSPH